MEPRVGNKFRLGRKIGSGSFGEIYLGSFFFLLIIIIIFFLCLLFGYVLIIFVNCVGTNIQTNEEVAIKLVSFVFFHELVIISSL
jgi:serine/threonine protein kinase